jgi:3',5'-cyclic AMP phosphodiesterase CpdA
MIRIGWISDTHLGRTGIGQWNNRELYDEAPRVVAEFLQKAAARQVDLIVVTGDVTDRGTPEAFRIARAAFADACAPVHFMAGNHDKIQDERLFTAWLSNGQRSETGCWSTNVNGYHCVYLDFPRTGKTYEFPDAHLAWLRADLDAQRQLFTFIFGHYPLLPYPDGGKALNRNDPYTMEERADMRELISQHPQVVGYFSGHHHYQAVRRIGHWVHVVGAAAIEYPMLYHWLEFDGQTLRMQSEPFSEEAARAASLVAGQEWAAGIESDCRFEVTYVSPSTR